MLYLGDMITDLFKIINRHRYNAIACSFVLLPIHMSNRVGPRELVIMLLLSLARIFSDAVLVTKCTKIRIHCNLVCYEQQRLENIVASSGRS